MTRRCPWCTFPVRWWHPQRYAGRDLMHLGCAHQYYRAMHSADHWDLALRQLIEQEGRR